jgi:arabinofuranan 3-O-arabinosyltransferase
LKGRFTRDRAITLGFVAFSFALALWQRPGWATADTKIDLHVDPSRFLGQVASAWTSTTDLGEVHSAQYSGYLWPMGPFFALLHSIGISPWLVQRLWLGLLFALSVWGMLKLLDALIGRPRGVAHVVAAACFLLNPYVAVFTARTSITLLGYAALPWLLLITHRGLHAAGGWRGLTRWMWAAAFALVLTSTGGGVNAAVVGWMLVGPLVLLLYEPAVGLVRWRSALAFFGQICLLGLLVSLWWIAPLLVHVRYGIDFLQFTEQPSSIWATNSITESLRLMGYWTSYIGVGFGTTRSFFSDGGTFLFNPLVVTASLLLPAIALAGFARARRMTYAPFLLTLVVVGVVIMMAGFPNGTPLRGAMLWLYQHVVLLRFARTTNKAAPLVAVGLAGLLGIGAQHFVARLRRLDGTQTRRVVTATAGAALLAILVFASLPLIRGQAIDTQLEFKQIPAAWRQAGAGLDRSLPQNTRALVLPGQIFAYYTWGGTLDAILPRLTSRPVAVRYETPYSDLHAVDLLTTVDDLVQQRRLVPGQLTPLLSLMGVGAVITGADDDISRSGAIDPAAAAGVLAEQLGAKPSDSYGPVKSLAPAAGDVGKPVALPEVRRYDTSSTRGLVHVDSSRPATLVDGSAQGLADLAAFGGLSAHAPIFYAGDLSTRSLRTQAAAGANVVITDSNRRRQFLPQSTQQNLGATLAATEPLPTNAAVINPVAAAGTNGQTVSVLQGARYLTAPSSAGELQFPEHAPIAAFDGSLSTSWIADRYLPVTNRWIEIGFNAPRDVPYVDLYPLSDTHGVVKVVDVNGVRQAVHPGWNRVVVDLHHVSALRVTIDEVLQPKVGLGGPGGFREIRIPGVHVRQLLRVPVITARALAGTNLSRDSISYVFERTTGDDPFRRNPTGATTILNSPQDRGDAEQYIDRLVFGLAPRAYSARAWVYPAGGTSDSTLDRFAGYTGRERLNSSGRFQDQPGYRASNAFDGRAPGWIGVWGNGQTPWISWSGPHPMTVSRLRISPSAFVVRRPTVVRLSWAGGQTGPLTVGAGGAVTLPAPARASAFRLSILQAAFPAGATTRQRQADAVGIGALSVPGLRPVNIPSSGVVHAGCGSVAVQMGDTRMPLRPAGTVARLDGGLPLPAVACGPEAQLGAGVQEIRALAGPFSIDLMQLRSPAPVPTAPAGGGTVVKPGIVGQSSVNGARVSLNGPSWLVLGESFDAGWRATCNGRTLGAPQPIDGYANGWVAPAGCRQVSFTFAPQHQVEVSYVISAIVVAALILLLIIGALRRRTRRPPPPPPPSLLPAERPGGLPLPRAIALALLLAVAVGWIFALRAGAVSFPVLALVLWRGYGAATLTWIAVFLLGIVVPIVYLIALPPDQGGYNFAYSTKLIGAHWIGVAGVVLLALACWRTIAAARTGRRTPGPVSPLDEGEQDPVGPVEQEVVRS